MFFSIMFIFSLAVLISLNHDLYYNVSFYNPFFSSHTDLNFCLGVKRSATIFVLMVSFVSCLVGVYSEFYMEGYNNLKFTMFMFMFFLSMVLLAFSDSMLLMIVGWDGLGLTSICLIMFYPNKTTSYNSLMTFLFNRLGDLMMVFCFAVLMSELAVSFEMLDYMSVSYVLIVLGFCTFTKSAQFPLSSWLPAAMAAPTPISAMVHSSTLVTAGLYIVMKLNTLFSSTFMLTVIFLASSLTFLAGGLMGSLEGDLKKLVAFSTMSQISMVMMFCASNLLGVAYMHMFFHALFKTSLFCTCGAMFLLAFSDQTKSLLKATPEVRAVSGLMFASIYSMTGLIFSSSFFSKDMALELFLESSSQLNFLVLILGSFLTMNYSKIILNSSYSWFCNLKVFANKLNIFNWFLVFMLITLAAGKLGLFYCLEKHCPLVGVQDLAITTFIFSLPIILSLKLKNKVLQFLPLEVFFMKFSTFFLSSIPSKVHYFYSITSSSDYFVFKPSLFVKGGAIKTLSLYKSEVAYILVLVILLTWSF